MLICFIHILKSFFKHFKLIIYRSHKSILSWFRLSISDGDIRRDVRVLLVDDTRIKIGSGEGIVYCFEPYLRRIVYMMTFDVANILTS